MMGRRFLYHAHGSAIGGTITRPFQADIEANAATSLPIIGGSASAKCGPYQLKDVVSFSSAHTYVSGSKTAEGEHSSVVTCVVEGLNILHTITADAIVGKLSSKHKDGQPTETLPLGSWFEKLKIGGREVEVDLDHELFLQYPTYAGLLGYLESGTWTPAQARYQWGSSSAVVPPALSDGMMMIPGAGWHKSNGVLHTSLVKQVRPAGSGKSPEELPYAYAINIPHVGNLYLGEYFASADIKRLSMLRLELGSPHAGIVAAVQPTANSGLFP